MTKKPSLIDKVKTISFDNALAIPNSSLYAEPIKEAIQNDVNARREWLISLIQREYNMTQETGLFKPSLGTVSTATSGASFGTVEIPTRIQNYTLDISTPELEAAQQDMLDVIAFTERCLASAFLLESDVLRASTPLMIDGKPQPYAVEVEFYNEGDFRPGEFDVEIQEEQ